MSKINFDTVLVTLDGQAVKARGPTEAEEKQFAATGKLPDLPNATLAFICGQALTAELEGEPAVEPPVKWQKFVIRNAIAKGGEVELTAEQLALLKERVGKLFEPIVMGQAWNLLEGRDAFDISPH